MKHSFSVIKNTVGFELQKRRETSKGLPFILFGAALEKQLDLCFLLHVVDDIGSTFSAKSYFNRKEKFM